MRQKQQQLGKYSALEAGNILDHYIVSCMLQDGIIIGHLPNRKISEVRSLFFDDVMALFNLKQARQLGIVYKCTKYY